jgi:ribosomal protein L34
LSTIWRLFQRAGRPPLTPAMIWLMGRGFQPTDAKARRDIGYKQAISLDDGMARLRQRRLELTR